LANIFGCTADKLTANQNPGHNSNQRETKVNIPNTFSNTELDRLDIFLFRCHFYFYANSTQFNIDIAKLTLQ